MVNRHIIQYMSHTYTHWSTVPHPGLSVCLFPIVDEEELRKKITEDLQKGLLKERAKAEQELQAW